MARIPFITPRDVPENERPAYDAFLQKRGNQLNAGPYALLSHMNAYELEAPAHATERALPV